MHLLDLKSYLVTLDSLLQQESTGTANELAKKLGVSERTLQNQLQQLREMGIEIVYDKYRKTYKYAQKGRITFGFSPSEMSDIRGGNGFIQLSPSEPCPIVNYPPLFLNVLHNI